MVERKGFQILESSFSNLKPDGGYKRKHFRKPGPGDWPAAGDPPAAGPPAAGRPAVLALSRMAIVEPPSRRAAERSGREA